MKIFCLAITLMVCFIDVNGHGVLYDPPARQVMDHLGYNKEEYISIAYEQCGTFNDGEHGCSACCRSEMECPGGEFCKNIVSRTYKAGSTIPVTLNMIANHGGIMRFSVCPSSNGVVAWDCLEENKLKITEAVNDPNSKGGLIYQWRNGHDIIAGSLNGDNSTLHVELPNIKCDRCVLQWHWTGASSSGKCANGTEGFGCGPQQHYINCADIKIE